VRTDSFVMAGSIHEIRKIFVALDTHKSATGAFKLSMTYGAFALSFAKNLKSHLYLDDAVDRTELILRLFCCSIVSKPQIISDEFILMLPRTERELRTPRPVFDFGHHLVFGIPVVEITCHIHLPGIRFCIKK